MKTYRSTKTGLFVGRQADQIEGETYEVVEVPQAKDEQIEFLNTIQGHKVDGEPSAPVDQPTPGRLGWLGQWDVDSAQRGKELHLAQELDEAIMRAPLITALRLAELVYGRLGDLAGKEKLDG